MHIIAIIDIIQLICTQLDVRPADIKHSSLRTMARHMRRALLQRKIGPARGYDAVDFRKIKHGDAGKLGNYSILFVLPDKFARILYEFQDFRFERLSPEPRPSAPARRPKQL
jgi:hypothetical protein